jgi:branched-chain amino acid transport system ATP-binding protein
MGDEVLLIGTDLHKAYGGVVALFGVNLRLSGGEILGLVGPNGAGKTTLVDLISGTQKADKGELTLANRRLDGPASQRAGMGLARTFQRPQLALELSVLENIMVGRAGRRHGSAIGVVWGAVQGMFGRASREDQLAVVAIAEELNLDRLDRLARDLTLGEQRLVEVARALAQDPLVLLLDEPFAGSDASGVSGINEVIRMVQRRGHGVVLVDHNVDLVSALVDRMMLLNLGRLVFDGDPQECLGSAEMQQIFFGGGTAPVD